MPVTYRNFKAWIHCEDDDETLEEYEAGPDPDDETVYTCWVASEAGKCFTVHWESLVKTDGDNEGVIFLDGVKVNSRINRMASNKIGTSRGVKLSTGELRPYCFSNVVLTDDESYLGIEQTTNIEEIGNITLKIYPGSTYTEIVCRPHPARHPAVTLYDGAIHETTKKICDHRITLGDAIPLRPPSSRYRKVYWKPRGSTPSVIFRFKYRSRAYLQAEGIIPRSPSVETTPQKPVINVNNSRNGSTEVGHRNNVLPVVQDRHRQKNSKRKRSNVQDEKTSSPLAKRVKSDPMEPVKVEDEVCLLVDEHGVIDLTMED